MDRHLEHDFSNLGKRRDETGDAHQPGICKQFGDLSDATDVLLTIVGREAQILVQTVANVVSVQRVTRDRMGHEELF